MATLQSSETFSVGTGTTTQEEVAITVIPAPVQGGATALGRLAHPTLGTYDYTTMPDQWGGFDTDVIIEPVWQIKKTLSSGSNTLWSGNIKDVEVYEKWTSAAAMTADMARMLISFYVNPPSPPSYVTWTPNYISSNSYDVIITGIQIGGAKGINFQNIILQAVAYVKGPVTLKMRIVDNA